MWVVARGGKSKKAEGGREEAEVQCKNSMVVKGGRMARKERGRGGEEASNTPAHLHCFLITVCLASSSFGCW